MSIHFDSGALEGVLKSAPVRAMVEKVANEVADHVRGEGITVGAFKGGQEISLPVVVSPSTTDRARALVILAHPAGIAVQAKHGALTRAASSAGLHVR